MATTSIKSTKFAPMVKHRVTELKKTLKLKSESEVVAYLIEFYGEFYPNMRIIQDQKFRENAKEMQKEQLLDLKPDRRRLPDQSVNKTTK